MNTTTPSNEAIETRVSKLEFICRILAEAVDDSVIRDNQLQAEIDDLRQDRAGES